MRYKIPFAFAAAIFFLINLAFAQNMQKRTVEEADFPDRFSRLETTLDELSQNTDKNNRILLQKLDQVLSNQEKILNELAIIKVRASKR